jgi:hypothetical protein
MKNYEIKLLKTLKINTVAKKKKKKVQTTNHQKNVAPKHSTTYLKTCYDSAKRILLSLGEEASMFDVFTKRQKQDIFRVVVAPPRVSIMPGHKVPKQYIRYIQEELIAYMKRTYFDEKLKVTWMDISVVGQSMMLIFAVDDFVESLSPQQQEVVDKLRITFETKELFRQIQDMIAGQIKMSLLLLSQPNFRIYGQDTGEQHIITNRTGFQQVVRITAHECQTLRFKYHNIERTAFRVTMGQYMDVPCVGATIPRNKIFPSADRDRLLNIYIQSHAIHRFKERIDTIYPILRNEFFVLSLMLVQKVVRGPNGMQLIACIMPAEGGEKTIGYFAFTIEGNNLLVLTLLPLLSHSVPEGRVLYERLHLSPEDLKYLGMDKLSFFYEVDIRQIPVLKQVLFDELHLDYVRTVYNSFRSKNDPFNEKKTLFVKNFFQKIEERPCYYDSEQDTRVESINVLDYEY